ncbi:hypothetical protein B0J13DRAFT_490770 [Dactylonectria estremocensis]|uniref:Glycoside hydrolase/deacetylase n=1 Tax=Dactylonectria estremocensis TaxID=1079267 RepID=A0A9P9JI03_9HYPO|nr:hypothetical protein B0J13DRAFT_490770 [Dactylonectria estremocensis]
MKTTISTTLTCIMLHVRAVLASPSMEGYLTSSHVLLQERAGNECGQGIGSCNPGSCCSGSGYCGTSRDHCAGSSCQLDYSDSCDTFFGPGGTSTANIARPKVGNVPYGNIITSCIEPRMMALTFDDGPYTYTSGILDILDEYNVKATFMIAGNNRGKGHVDDSSLDWPGVLRRMYAAGHHIASHTWTHRDLNDVNSTIQRTEMIYNEIALRNIFGWIPTYMRPPYLECSASSGCQALMNELGYHVINTDLDTKDWEYDSSALIQNAKDRFDAGVSANAASNSYIVLAHDSHEQTVTNLTAYMITTAQDRGYKLVTVGECLGDPIENWYRQDSTGGTPSTTTTATTRSNVSSTNSKSSSSATSTSGVIISPNQQCGGDTGYTCIKSGLGNCCSFYGYCGSSDVYCGTGCDADFGECNPTTENVMDTTNGLCGPLVDATCANYGAKTCCSQYGYCGSSAGHCGAGCQTGYGTCT